MHDLSARLEEDGIVRRESCADAVERSDLLRTHCDERSGR